MACIKKVNRSTSVALSPESPYFATRTMVGDVDISFSSSANHEIFQLDFQSDVWKLPLVGAVPISEIIGFHGGGILLVALRSFCSVSLLVDSLMVISGYGILIAHRVIPAWLSCLPIKGDLIEAKVVHDLLCSMIERSDMELLGPNNQYLLKIVSVFVEVLCAGKDLATEQMTGRIISLLRQLQQTLPPSTLASTWSSLDPQQQLALQSILSSS